MRSALAAAAVFALAAAACGSSKEPRPAPGSASAAAPSRVTDPAPPPTSPTAPPPTGGAFPAACDEYRETVERLARCGDALPPSTRDGLRAHFERQRAGWERLPDKDKRELAAICKSSSDTVKAATSAACGW